MLLWCIVKVINIDCYGMELVDLIKNYMAIGTTKRIRISGRLIVKTWCAHSKAKTVNIREDGGTANVPMLV